jgi:hypothetical protein
MTVGSPRASVENKTPVILAPCDRSPQQAATFVGDSIVFEGKCLDLPGSETAPGTGLAVYECNGGTNQQFTWQPDGTLRVLGRCVSAAGADERRPRVVIEACTGAPEQRIERVPLLLP